MIITSKWLREIKVCKAGLLFFSNNFPNGLDTNKVEISGDYKDYYEFIKKAITFKKYGKNIYKKIYPSGAKYVYEYEQGRLAKKIYPSGATHLYKYKDGKQIEIFPSGKTYTNECEYDHLNRLIRAGDLNIFYK